MSTQTETTTVTTPPKKPDTVQTALEKMKPQLAFVLPKHITADRMVRIALNACQTTPKLLECDRQSFYSAIMRAAQLGLEPDGILGQAYLIPYGDKVQFIVGYKGLIDLARRSGEVSNIIAKEVYENDEFTVDWSQEIPFHHKPKLEGERGEVKFFWALARFKDGGFHWDFVSKDEIIAIRDNSSGYKSAVATAKKYNKPISSPWEQHFIEMGKKTAIRRIAKFLPMSVQRAAMVEDLVDAGKKFSTSEMGDIVIDGDAVEVANDDQAKKTSKIEVFANANVDKETGEIKPPPLATVEERATAGNQLIMVLESMDPEFRPSAFVQAFGPDIVEALTAHKQTGLVEKITALGIVLGEAA